MRKAIIIQAATGSGKTDLAYSIAKQLNGELISADSRQIYRFADIGTNKTKFDDIITHLIDIKDPNQPYNAHTFKEDALKAIDDIFSYGKIPIIVGGTNFYIDVLTGKQKLSILDENFKKYEKKRRLDLESLQKENLQEIYKSIEPQRFEHLNNSEKNNPHRLINKIIFSEYFKENEIMDEDESYLKNIDFLQIGIKIQKNDLDKNIFLRTDDMIKRGLKDEVINILERFGKDSVILRTIGYNEYIEFAENEKQDKELVDSIDKIDKIDEELIKKRITMNTIHYAKRQVTWMKRDENILWYEKRDDLSNKVISEVIKKVYH